MSFSEIFVLLLVYSGLYFTPNLQSNSLSMIRPVCSYSIHMVYSDDNEIYGFQSVKSRCGCKGVLIMWHMKLYHESLITQGVSIGARDFGSLL